MVVVAIILVLSSLFIVYYNDTKKDKEQLIESGELRGIIEKNDLNYNFTHTQNVCKKLIEIIESNLYGYEPKLEFNIDSIDKMTLKGHLTSDVYLLVKFYISSKSISAEVLITKEGVEYKYQENSLNKHNNIFKDAYKIQDYIYEHVRNH